MSSNRVKDDFFVSADDDAPAVAPQEYLADLSRLDESEDVDGVPFRGGKKRKREEEENGSLSKPKASKLRKR